MPTDAPGSNSGRPDTNSQLPSPISRTLQLTVAYDGTDFLGFQRLKSGRSVQAELEAAWRDVTGEPARIIGAGRTDAGVHAFGQVVSLRTETRLPTDRAALALNGRLPKDIRIRSARERGDEFHARFSATQRTYQYWVRRAGRPSVFWDRFSLLEPRGLDVFRMQEAGRVLIGSHDFGTFGSPERGRTAVRDLRAVRFKEWGQWLVISLTANAFLKSMARSLTANLLAAGRCELSADEIRERLEARDRGLAGKAAPPNGLYLARVDY